MTGITSKQVPAKFNFSALLVQWQKAAGRHALPWQQTRDAYRIWLSEIMLQQTQVATVIPYYARFLERFPDVAALAEAPVDAVLSEWSGLGYYSRARNLHRCAQQVVAEYDGHFPEDAPELEKLPGIGRSTAAAIAVFSRGKKAAILDGNVIRVFSRLFGIDEYAGNKQVKDRLWAVAEMLLPDQEIESYTQGLMDFGATLCTRSRPNCKNCPFSGYCVAYQEDRTAILPVRKPSKALPEKAVYGLVLIAGGKVLLEKRPDSGIWGGLLSLPELSATLEEGDRASVENWVKQFHPRAKAQHLDKVRHVFTHFRLQIFPLLVELAEEDVAHLSEKWTWLMLNEVEKAPLPAPIKKLLLRICDMQQQVLPVFENLA